MRRAAGRVPLQPLKMNTRKDLLLVEDSELFARMVVAAFADERWTTAMDIAEAADAIAEAEHDGLVVDLNLPGGTIWPILESLRAARPTVPVLVLTGSEEPDAVNRAQQLGVEIGYKSAWRAVISSFLGRVEETLNVRVKRFAARHHLSPRETEVLGRYVEDYSRSEIAARLGISERTLRAHFEAVLRKTGLRRVSAVRQAVRRRPA